jgi:hypothetical protein
MHLNTDNPLQTAHERPKTAKSFVYFLCPFSPLWRPIYSDPIAPIEDDAQGLESVALAAQFIIYGVGVFIVGLVCEA